jgi:C-terminal processing protease CtpA/Prc
VCVCARACRSVPLSGVPSLEGMYLRIHMLAQQKQVSMKQEAMMHRAHLALASLSPPYPGTMDMVAISVSDQEHEECDLQEGSDEWCCNEIERCLLLLAVARCCLKTKVQAADAEMMEMTHVRAAPTADLEHRERESENLFNSLLRRPWTSQIAEWSIPIENRVAWCGVGAILSRNAPYVVLKSFSSPSTEDGLTGLLPAEPCACILEGDVVLAVGDIVVDHLQDAEVQWLLAGPRGSKVSMTVLRDQNKLHPTLSGRGHVAMCEVQVVRQVSSEERDVDFEAFPPGVSVRLVGLQGSGSKYNGLKGQVLSAASSRLSSSSSSPRKPADERERILLHTGPVFTFCNPCTHLHNYPTSALALTSAPERQAGKVLFVKRANLEQKQPTGLSLATSASSFPHAVPASARTESRIKRHDVDLFAQLAAARRGGFKISVEKFEEKLAEHLRNSKHARKEWIGLGLKLSTSPPYRICDSPEEYAGPKPEMEESKAQDTTLNTFTILLSVDGVELANLKRFEVVRLFSGPPGTRVNVSVARASCSGEGHSLEAVDLILLRALEARNKSSTLCKLHDVPLYPDTFFGVELVSAGSVRQVSGSMQNIRDIPAPDPEQLQKDESEATEASIRSSPADLQPSSLYESNGGASISSASCASEVPSPLPPRPLPFPPTAIYPQPQKYIDIKTILEQCLVAPDSKRMHGSDRTLSLPTPPLFSDVSSAFGSRLPTASDADMGISFFGLPVGGVLKPDPRDPAPQVIKAEGTSSYPVDKEGRVKSRDIQLLAQLASARKQGYKLSAEKAQDQLTEHVRNSRQVRREWCGLGWRLSSAPPYTIVDAQTADSPEAEELSGYNIVLVVEGVPVENLLLAELQTLFSGPRSSSIAVTVGHESTGASRPLLLVRPATLANTGPSSDGAETGEAAGIAEPGGPAFVSFNFFGLEMISIGEVQEAQAAAEALGQNEFLYPSRQSEYLCASRSSNASRTSHAQATLSLPTPPLLLDVSSAFRSRLPTSSDTDTGISFFGLPIGGVLNPKPAPPVLKALRVTNDQVSSVAIKARERSLMLALALARLSGCPLDLAALAGLEQQLKQLTQSAAWKDKTADWGGIGVKMSVSPPYVIEGHSYGEGEGMTLKGDVIQAVDDVPVHSLALREVQMLIRGPVGSEVSLHILRSPPTGDLQEMQISATRKTATQPKKEPVSVPVRKGEVRVGAAQASFSFFGLEVTGIEPKENSAVQIKQVQQIKRRELSLVDAIAVARDLLSTKTGSLGELYSAETRLSEFIARHHDDQLSWWQVPLEISSQAPYKITSRMHMSREEADGSQGTDEVSLASAKDDAPRLADTVLAVEGISLRALKSVEVQLLLAGPPGWNAKLTLSRGAENLSESDEIVYLPRIFDVIVPTRAPYLTFCPAVHFSLPAPAQRADSGEQESGTRAIDEGLSEYEDVLHNDLASPPEGRSEVNVEAGDLVVSDHAVRGTQQFTQRDLDTCSLHPSFKQQLDWRYAEDMCMLDLVHAREAAMQARGDLNASVEEVLEATERCSATLLAVQYLRNHPEQQAGRDAWSGVGLLVMSTPESFFVVAVLDVLWFQHPHLTPDCSPVHVEDEVMAINGVSTMLLTSGEVEQLLMGPQGSSCILTLASPRFDMSDGIRMVELLRHNNDAPAQQALI